MAVRSRGVAAALVALGLAGLVAADEGEPVVPYAEASGTAPAGLLGLGVQGLDLTTVSFLPNASHPRLQILLDYEPADLTAEAGPLTATLLYEFVLELRDGATNGTIMRWDFTHPGERYFLLNATTVVGQPFFMDVYARVGVDVDWWLAVRGWRSPIPI